MEVAGAMTLIIIVSAILLAIVAGIESSMEGY